MNPLLIYQKQTYPRETLEDCQNKRYIYVYKHCGAIQLYRVNIIKDDDEEEEEEEGRGRKFTCRS